MANPWSIPAMGWVLSVVGWLLSPVVRFYLQKLTDYLIFDARKELLELKNHTVPALKAALRDVEEQRMVRAARDLESRSESDLARLDDIDVDLKSALCQAEDILDLVEYHRIEKEVTGDDGSWGVQQLINAAGSSIGSWVQRCIDITPAPLLQFVHSMRQKLGQLCGGISLLWSSGALLPISQATSSTVGVQQRICGWCRQLVANITSCCRSLLSWCTQRIEDAQYYRDWSYEQVGIKSDLKKDGDVPVTTRIRLRKQIKGIEDILTSSKKSNLLNQNSSSTTVKESRSEQTQTDVLHTGIKQKVFGRDKERDEISRMLRAPNSSTGKPYSVIGIYGITGSGKSTLAQYICDDEEKAGHFDPIMFIHVGKTFSVGGVFRDMMKQITKSQPPNDESLKSLKTMLQETLKDKCFLLVLDDLWVNDDNQKELDILLDMLRLSAALSGSRVLVTSQKTDAAEALGAQEQISIPDLEEGVYLSLFMHHARPDASNDDGEYERVGRKIANRLGRSPIAAVTVGKQLQRNKDIRFWKTTANLDVLNKTMGALWWSYQQLGDDIRRCFAYCSIFPKGCTFERDQMVHIWIAQGFVNTRSNSTEEPEDIGQSYFDELLRFSFLQVKGTIFGTGIVEFTIHDLLHELAERVSGCELYKIGLNGLPKDIPGGVHHLFIETNNVVEIAEKNLDLGNLRTLIIYGERVDTMDNHDLEKVLGHLFMRLRKLRVLIIQLYRLINEVSVPVSIYHMKHLRYVCFACTLSRLILPSTFSKLYQIQFIEFRDSDASYPEYMANLTCLRHISVRLLSGIPNIEGLTSLQTLPLFKVEEGQGYRLKQLKHLNKLRDTLFIDGLENVRRKEEALEAHLTHKERLRKLELSFGRDKRVGPDVEAEVLEGLCPPKDLQELKIWHYMGSRYPSWMFSRHHPDTPKQLHRLELWICSSQLASIPEDSEFFISLRELLISDCDWDRLPENMERLVSLQTLDIRYCNKMELLPTKLPHALKKIGIWSCNMLRSIRIVDCPRLEFVREKEKCLEAWTSLEYCQDTAPPTGTPEQSPYPMIRYPCLVSLKIEYCANLVTLQNLPPSLKELVITSCGELCSVSGQLGQLEKLHIYDCNKLQSVDSLGDASSLEILFLSSCQCLASLGSSGGPGSYLALRELWIKYCPAMDMKQFNKNVLDGLVLKAISEALSSDPDESAYGNQNLGNMRAIPLVLRWGDALSPSSTEMTNEILKPLFWSSSCSGGHSWSIVVPFSICRAQAMTKQDCVLSAAHIYGSLHKFREKLAFYSFCVSSAPFDGLRARVHHADVLLYIV